MSLINDALKRAAAEKPRDAHSSAPVPPLQPVETAPSPSSPILPWAILLLGLGVVAIAAVLWFRNGSSQIAQATPNTPGPVPVVTTATSPETAPIIAAPSVAPNNAARLNAASSAPVATNAVTVPETAVAASRPPAKVAAANAPRTTEPKASPAPATPPVSTASAAAAASRPPKLQAIYYRMKGPTVIINGKTLQPGQSVDGIKVVSIQRTSVEIVQNGKYRTLTLQD